MGCNKCGACCEGLSIGIESGDIFKRDEDPSIEFIRAHWKPISLEEGKKRNWFANDISPDTPMTYLECDQYDREAKVCKCYEDRPYICSGYPFYNHKWALTKDMIPPTCGYREDIDILDAEAAM